jgi:hypothetical protein
MVRATPLIRKALITPYWLVLVCTRRISVEVRFGGRMATKRKTWQQKLEIDKSIKRVRLEKDFAGITAGSMMLVATPKLVDAYIKKIPRGETRTIPRFRRELARQNGCDSSCPVSTAIFIRIAAEAAWEEIEKGSSPNKVTPFWRLIEPGSTIAKKLSVDSNWLKLQREREGIVD